MTEKVFPTVARMTRIGGAMVNHLSMAWYCQKDVTLGAAVVGTAVVPLSSSKLELYAVVTFQFHSGGSVSLPLFHELVAYMVPFADDEMVGDIAGSNSSISSCCIFNRIPSITAPQDTGTWYSIY